MNRLDIIKAVHMVAALLIEKGRPISEEELRIFKQILIMAVFYIDEKENELPF